MARKILFYEMGPADVLKIVEVPTPEPGAGEIRIQVKAIGLNRAEINFRSTLSSATSFRHSRPAHSSLGSRRRFPSNVSSTLTAISSQTTSSVKSSSPFSVLSGAVSNDEEMYIPAACVL